MSTPKADPQSSRGSTLDRDNHLPTGKTASQPPQSSRGSTLDRRLLREAAPARLAVLAAGAIGAGQTAFLVVQAVTLASIVTKVFLGNRGLLATGGDFMTLGIAVVGRALLAQLGEVQAQDGSSKVKSSLRRRLLGAITERGPVWLAGERTGQIAVTATHGLDGLDGYFARYLPQLILAVVAPAVIVAWVITADWLSALILCVTLGLIPVFMFLLGQEARSRMDRQWERVERLSGHFLDVVQGLPTLRLFGRAKAQARTIARITDELREETMQTLRYAFLSSLVLELLASLSTALVALVLGLKLISGQISLAPALAILLLTPEVYLPLRRASSQFHSAAEGVGASGRILDLLELPGHIAQPPLEPDRQAISIDAAPFPPHIAEMSPDESSPSRLKPQLVLPEPAELGRAGTSSVSLHMEHVSFTWPGRQKPALSELDLSVEAGSHLAIVGPSGSGKSTLGLLVLGFVQPDAGQLLVDGERLVTIAIKSWREQVSWLPQEPTIFSASVAENLRLAAPKAGGEEIAAALDAAGATEVVNALPNGLDTVLGEGGWRLSAGQRQRLALARALLRPAKLYVLDEPTEHLDAETEQEVASSLWSYLAGRTVLVMTHRPILVQGADCTFELGNPQMQMPREPADG
ncbi:MAG: thiol reductant ABC exporter subunit CydD [Actinobacteria bacterium]|nr:thiol reductant ABC exporter subunit CydD [Actinomycetota bacterium]